MRHFGREPLSRRAAGRWASILPQIGLDKRFLSRRNGPCPFCGGRDRYRFSDLNGTGSWICSQCQPDGGNGADLVMRLKGVAFPEAAALVEPLIETAPVHVRREKPAQDKRADLQSMWASASVPVSGDPVMCWLGRRCGVTIPPAGIRTAMHLAHWDSEQRIKTHHPAMLARFWSPDGTSSTIHRTYLTQDGRKAAISPVRMLMPGDVPIGGAVRLMAPVDGEIVIGEGIETCLAASRLWSTPAWACLTAGLLAAWEPPGGIERVIIAGDNDESFSGQYAAYRLARRLARLGIRTDVRIAPDAGTDWNDVLARTGGENEARD